MVKQILITIASVVLVGCVNPEVSLSKAVASGDTKAAERAILAGANVNAKDDQGTTPLLRAAYFGHKEIAELLIANGANVNSKSKYGKTPLDLVVDESRKETYDLLRKHGGKTGEELKAEGE